MKIEAIIVDGVVYDVVKPKVALSCDECDFNDKGNCALDNECFAVWDDKCFQLKRIKTKGDER